jgi:hypothetical protein
MPIFNALMVTVFLILLAASAAVVGSMVVLGLLDLVFAKRSGESPAATDMMDGDELDQPPAEPSVEVVESKPKPEQALAA